jgi:hypothetical protein
MPRAHALAFLVFAAAILSLSCKTEKIRDISSRAPVGLSAEQVGAAVVAGTARRQWIIVEREPGRVVARIDVRGRHMAEVAIQYDQHGYAIAYHDSENLAARKGRVHQNYLRWIANLDRAIRAELVRVSVSSPASPPSQR